AREGAERAGRADGVGVKEEQRAADRRSRAFVHLQTAVSEVEFNDSRKIEPASFFESAVNAPAVNDDDFGAVIDRAWPQRGEGRADLRLFIERGNDNADRHTVCGLRRGGAIIPAPFLKGFQRSPETETQIRRPTPF